MQKDLSPDFIERIKKELSSFAPRAAAIAQQELELSEIPKPKEVQERSIRKYDNSNRKQYNDIQMNYCQ